MQVLVLHPRPLSYLDPVPAHRQVRSYFYYTVFSILLSDAKVSQHSVDLAPPSLSSTTSQVTLTASLPLPPPDPLAGLHSRYPTTGGSPGSGSQQVSPSLTTSPALPSYSLTIFLSYSLTIFVSTYSPTFLLLTSLTTSPALPSYSLTIFLSYSLTIFVSTYSPTFLLLTSLTTSPALPFYSLTIFLSYSHTIFLSTYSPTFLLSYYRPLLLSYSSTIFLFYCPTLLLLTTLTTSPALFSYSILTQPSLLSNSLTT